MKKKKGIVYGCIALAAVVVIAIVAVLFFSKKDEGDPKETETVTASAGESQDGETGESSNTEEDGENPSNPAEEPDFSAGLTDDGVFEGITALDYVTLADYKGIKVPAEEVTVSDEDFDVYMKTVLSDYKESVSVTDRAVEKGDTANIDYVGTLDGEKFEGGSAQGYNLEIGSGAFIAGFEDQIIGHEIGENFDITVTFPDKYDKNPDMAGRETVFNITINSITTSVIPEVTDEFVAENFSDYSSAEEYLEDIRNKHNRDLLKSYVWAEVLKNSTVSEIPEALIDNYVEQQVKMYKYMASAYGMSYEDLLSYYGTTVEEFEASERQYANTDLTKMLVSQAICEKEDITVEEGEDLEIFNYTEENMAEIYDDYGKGYVNQILRMEKVANFIADESVIEK